MTYDYGTSSPGTGTPSSGGWPADEQPTTQLPPVPAGTQDLPSTGSAGSGGQTVDVAKDEAMGVAGSAKEKGGDLLGEGVDQARSVAGEAGRQARDLMDEARVELAAQAYDQQQRVAGGLRTFGQELSSMAEHSSEGGLAADLARQLASRSTDLAQWLDDREPGSVLDEVKEFARRRPGAFLAIAAGAGVLAGRLTRGLKDAQEEGSAQRPAAQRSTPSHLATQPPERVTAWPATGVQQEGAGYATTGYAGYPSGVTADEATTAGEYGTAGSGYGGAAGSGYGGAAGSGYGGAGAGAYDDAGYGTGADETADPLDAPLRPDPATDPDALPRNEEGWR